VKICLPLVDFHSQFAVGVLIQMEGHVAVAAFGQQEVTAEPFIGFSDDLFLAVVAGVVQENFVEEILMVGLFGVDEVGGGFGVDADAGSVYAFVYPVDFGVGYVGTFGYSCEFEGVLCEVAAGAGVDVFVFVSVDVFGVLSHDDD
jgi:hypothetical protein